MVCSLNSSKKSFLINCSKSFFFNLYSKSISANNDSTNIVVSLFTVKAFLPFSTDSNILNNNFSSGTNFFFF